MKLKTQQGTNASILGLAAYPQTDAECVQLALNSGINYFFFYDSDNDNFLEGLKTLLTRERNSILVTTGSEARDINTLRQYLEQVRRRLNTHYIDVFFTEYVSPNDDINNTHVVFDDLRSWKQQGFIRYIGASTHNRSIALHNQAVNLALTAPQSVSQLKENLSVLNAPLLSSQEVQQWQLYGALIYGTGQDAFDTQWV